MSYEGNTATIAKPETPAPTQGKRKTILIVDDDRVFSSALAEGLMSVEEGLTVYTAENGYQAAAVLNDVSMDLLITDLRMPVMGGLELTHRVNEMLPSVPVIVISAYADTSTVLELETQGNYFFDKPVDYDHLLETIRALLL
ncbi:MAG TPA: response regulator [Nitrospirota bacterium]|jgi:DNA-binding NtrC family response regulator|nr:response regulator [Nitrospirota bacterium]